MFGLFIDRFIQQTWFPVIHKVVLGAYLIYLYRVEVLPRECVHLQSTCFRVSCRDIIEISLCDIWVRCVISSFLGVFGKAHNLMDCADLAVLMRMKHTHGLPTVDFDVSVRPICHYDVKDTWSCNSIIHSHQSFLCITVWVMRSVFEWEFKHTTLANVWFSLWPG